MRTFFTSTPGAVALLTLVALTSPLRAVHAQEPAGAFNAATASQPPAALSRPTAPRSTSHRGFHRWENWSRLASDPTALAMLQIRQIEGIYRSARDIEGLRTFYEDVLARTSDPRIRTLVSMKLGAVARRTGDSAAALTQLESALEENLQRIE